jgi:hypothetical protein
MNWADNLIVTDPATRIVYDDWRLPTALNPDGTISHYGYNRIHTEQGHHGPAFFL